MEVLQKQVMEPELIKKIDDAGVIAVLVIDNIDHALPLANALLEGGVNTIELTLRTPAALGAAKQIKRNLPEITLGFGTIINKTQVKQVVDVGADFAVSPGCNPMIIEEAYKQGLSFAPGVVTPTDIEMAVAQGCRILKFFPAETSGGMEHLLSMSNPYQYLDLRFIPLGGLNINNAKEYLASPIITAIGGSWIAKRDTIQNEEWNVITKNAQEISTLINTIKHNQ